MTIPPLKKLYVRQDRIGPDLQSANDAGEIYPLHIAAAVPKRSKCNNAAGTRAIMALFARFADGDEISAIGLTTFLWQT
jgi:hypothetical protein